MATVEFYANALAISHLNGSGLGFYKNSFASSVNVGEYQDSTFITDSLGLNQGPQVDNIKYTHPNSGSINGLTSVNVLNIPNYLSTLRIRFNHTSPVKTQNAKFRVYDRNNINNDPSGVLCKVYEVIHPSTSQTGNLGSGTSSWITTFGSGSIVSLVASPGTSGIRPNGANTTDQNHDWYVAISASPSSVGSKYFAGYFSVEFL
jgi:hypothetical protein